MSQLSLFQKRIHDEIPLSRALGIQLHSWDGHSLLLSAPGSVVASIAPRLPLPGA